MFRRDSLVATMLKKHWRPAVLAAAAAPLLLVGSNAGFAQALTTKVEGPVQLMFTVPIPPAPKNKTGGMYGFDISFVDQKNQVYYLGDRSNAAVDVVDAKTGTFVKHLFAKPAFAGAIRQQQHLRPEWCRGRRRLHFRRRRPKRGSLLQARRHSGQQGLDQGCIPCR